MAWEWSHTTEAYSNAYENILDLNHDTLSVVYAEIRAKRWDDENPDETSSYDNGKYEEFLEEGKELTNDILADFVWQFAEEYRTCDNGGFNAYICPHGCHTVSFGREVVDA